MSDPHQLAQEAGALDDRQWRVFLGDLSKVRNQRWETEGDELPPGVDRDRVAEWIAKKHLAVDPGITDILYLPGGAPPEEIRLIEANALLATLPDEDVSPIDFGLNLEGLNFRLLVVDVTPSQWNKILERKSAIPEDWSLKDARRFGYPQA